MIEGNTQLSCIAHYLKYNITTQQIIEADPQELAFIVAAWELDNKEKARMWGADV